jgi:hypothetical protein
MWKKRPSQKSALFFLETEKKKSSSGIAIDLSPDLIVAQASHVLYLKVPKALSGLCASKFDNKKNARSKKKARRR